MTFCYILMVYMKNIGLETARKARIKQFLTTEFPRKVESRSTKCAQVEI